MVHHGCAKRHRWRWDTAFWISDLGRACHQIEFPDDSFDVVTCTFVLMFRPDPAAVVREIRRVLKPVGRFLPSPVPDPKAPGTFRLAPAEELDGVLRAGGFSDFTVETCPFKVMFESVGRHWQIFSEMAPPLKAAAETLPQEDLRRLKDAIANALVPYTEDGRALLPATPICAAGRK